MKKKNTNRIRCYDTGPKRTIDRYTVVYLDNPQELWQGYKGYKKEYACKEYSCVGMNAAPFHPQGFRQHTTCTLGRHLGKMIKFKSLPIDCKTLVLQDLNGEPPTDTYGRRV